MSPKDEKPRVLVVMSTYNGEKFLEKQIKSILNQQDVELRVCIRDDVSTDNTREILSKYINPKFIVLHGSENIGTTRSLKILIKEVLPGEYLALADQDDIWSQNHLISGVRTLQLKKDNSIGMYFPIYKFIDENDAVIGNRKPRIKIGLENALIENPAIGCGIILNQFASMILKKIDLIDGLFIDKQLYFIASATGFVLQGNATLVSYRIHSSNQVGIFRRKRIWSLREMINQLKISQRNLQQLYFSVVSEIPAEEKNLVASHFEALQESSLKRIIYSTNPKFRREKWLDQLLIQLLCALGLLY